MASKLAEAAKAIRADIRAELADGTLPALPEGMTIRVRSARDSLSTSIDIDVMNAPRSWAYTGGPRARNGSSPANLQLREALRKIAERHYEADGQGRFIIVQVYLGES